MDKFQHKYRVPSARAEWHKYDGGAYFITICTAGKVHCFGEIADGKMQLSQMGNIAKDCLTQIQSYYPYAEIPVFVIMPNHIHAIVIIDDDTPYRNDQYSRDAINRVSTPMQTTISRNPMVFKSLGTVIRGVKARISRVAHKNGISFRWQSRFYDHIIRDNAEMNNEVI